MIESEMRLEKAKAKGSQMTQILLRLEWTRGYWLESGPRMEMKKAKTKTQFMKTQTEGEGEQEKAKTKRLRS